MLDTLYDRYQIKVANESTTYLPPLLFQLPNEWMAKTFATTTFFNGVRASKSTIFYRIKFTHLTFE